MINSANENTIPVELYIDGKILSGQMICPARFRLLDLFNSISTLDRESRGEFIAFYNTSGMATQDTYREQPLEYVRKSAVEVVAISEGSLGRGIGANPGVRIYPFVHKVPQQIQLQLKTFTIMGTLHMIPRQTIQGILNEDTRFLPLTDVTISREGNLYATRPFVAVNKQHIVYSHEQQQVKRSAEQVLTA